MSWETLSIEVSDPWPLPEEQVEWIERWAEEELRTEVADCGFYNCRLCQREQQIAHTRVMSVLTGY